MSEQQEQLPVKKTLGIMAGVIAFGALLALGIMWWLSDDGDDFEGQESLNSEQRRTVEQLSEEFIQTAGTFGLDHEDYRAEDYFDILKASFSDNVDKYYQTRADVYENVQEEFIHEEARVNYPESVYENWDDSVEYDHQKQFRIEEDSLDITQVSDFFVLEGTGNTKYRAVNVDVDYTSVVTDRYQTATDITWDGSIEVVEDRIPSHIRIVYVQTGENTWRIFELREQNKPHTLVTWSTRDTQQDHSHNPQVIDRLEREEPLNTEGDGENTHEDIDNEIEYLD